MTSLSKLSAKLLLVPLLAIVVASAPVKAQTVFDVIIQESIRQQQLKAMQDAQAREAAAYRAAEEQRVRSIRQTWTALDENVRACVNMKLQQGGQSIDVMVQQGIVATDGRLAKYVGDCGVISSQRLMKGLPCTVEGTQSICNEVFVFTSAPTMSLGPDQLATAVVANRTGEIGTTQMEAPDARAKRVAAAELRRRGQILDAVVAKLGPLVDPSNEFMTKRATALLKSVKAAQTNPKIGMEQITQYATDAERMVAEDREEKLRIERVRNEKLARGEVDFKSVGTGANQKVARTNAYWDFFLRQLRDVAASQADGNIGKDFRAIADKDIVKFKSDFFTSDTTDKCVQAQGGFRCEVQGTFKTAALKAEIQKVMSSAIATGGRKYRFIMRYAEPEDHPSDCGEQKAETTRFLVNQVSAEFSRRGYTIVAKSAEEVAEQKGEFDYYINLLDINHCDSLDANGNFLSITLRAQLKLLDKASDPSKRTELANVPVSNTKRTIRNPQVQLAAVKRESVPIQGAELAGQIVRDVDAKLLTLAQSNAQSPSNVTGAVRSTSQYSLLINGLGQSDRQQIRALRDLIKSKLGVETTLDSKGTTDKSVEITFDYAEKFDPEDIVDALYDLFKERKKTFKMKYSGNRSFVGQY